MEREVSDADSSFKERSILWLNHGQRRLEIQAFGVFIGLKAQASACAAISPIAIRRLRGVDIEWENRTSRRDAAGATSADAMTARTRISELEIGAAVSLI